MFEIELFGNRLCFETDPGLFSPGAADRGTLVMMRFVHPASGDKVMDLGCGYGLVGVALAKVVGAENVTMIDVHRDAVGLAHANALRNGVPGAIVIEGDGPEAGGGGFDWVLSNPPYHMDFSVPKRFIEQGFRSLKLGGRMVMVVKRLDWYRNKLTSVFGGVTVREEDGYFVLSAEKRRLQPGSGPKTAKTTRKHLKRTMSRPLKER